jgi:hypothetical protein
MKRRKMDDGLTPRPLCTTCGAPAFMRVDITTRQLVLTRDAGIQAIPYWTTDYRSGMEISSVLCQPCFKGSVQVVMNVAAKVVGKEST